MDDTLRQAIRRHLRSALATEARDHEMAVEVAHSYVPREASAAEVASLLPEVIAEYDASKAEWPPETDCDRLDAAFDELNAQGIMARHDWWCCGTCGAAAMADEHVRLAALDPEHPPRGYTFYDQQGTEAAADGQSLYLSYGTADDAEPAALEIAREVVVTLERHGLRTIWNGSYDWRIEVALVWQRRKRPERWTEPDD